MRFDIPTIGLKTLEVCAHNKIDVLAFEAEKTLLLDADMVANLAKKQKISVVAVQFDPQTNTPKI